MMDKAEYIKTSIDITDVVSFYVDLKSGGQTYKCVCPFHDDNNPSMHIYRRTQTFKCFACNAGGDMLKFVQDMEGLEFKETLSLLAERYHLQLPDNGKQNKRSSHYKPDNAQIMQEINLNRERFTDYDWLLFKTYNIPPQTAQIFQVGSDLNGNLTLPLRDTFGQVRDIAYLNNNLKMGNRLGDYRLKTLVFGLYESRRMAYKHKRIKLCYHPVTVLQNHIFGKTDRCGTVSAFGLPSKDQIEAISKFADTLILAFDDNRSRIGVLQVIVTALRKGHNVKIKPYLEYEQDWAYWAFNNLKGPNIVERIRQTAKQIPDPTYRELYLSFIDEYANQKFQKQPSYELS